jgi:signal peptidase I
MRNEILFVNGKAADYDEAEVLSEPIADGRQVKALRLTERTVQSQRRVQMLEGVDARNTFGPLDVPAGNYLMLGDNRDNSADSRYFGFVPRRLIIGQAQRIIASADITGNWSPRFERFGRRLE